MLTPYVIVFEKTYEVIGPFRTLDEACKYMEEKRFDKIGFTCFKRASQWAFIKSLNPPK